MLPQSRQRHRERERERETVHYTVFKQCRPASAVATEMPSKPKTMAISMAFVRGTCLKACHGSALKGTGEARGPLAGHSPRPNSLRSRSTSPWQCRSHLRTADFLPRGHMWVMCDRITGVGAVSGAALLFTARPIVGLDAIASPNRLKVLEAKTPPRRHLSGTGHA